MKPIRYHVEARVELDEAIGYFERKEPGLGLRLGSEVEAIEQRIQTFPELYGVWESTTVRECPLHRFPYAILYAVLEDYIKILAVANTKRRPGYWLDRLTDL